MEQLTPRQRDVLRTIADFVEWNGYAPTLEEIARQMRIGKPTAQQYIRALEQKGALRRKRYAHRGIEVVRSESITKRTELPILGRIAAGRPLEAVEAREVVDIAGVLGLEMGKDVYLLQVRGDSMVEEGIFDGDYVVVERREMAENGQTVVALLEDGSVTLKKFYREKGRVRLQPAHPAMQPIYAKRVTIQGVVRGVVRSVK